MGLLMNKYFSNSFIVQMKRINRLCYGCCKMGEFQNGAVHRVLQVGAFNEPTDYE